MTSQRETLNGHGLLLAVLGFAISRFVVAEALQADGALSFFLPGLLPLVAGLGLSAAGVGLAVGRVRALYVRSVTRWALLGTAAMSLVIALTAADALLRGETMGVRIGSGLFAANVLLGGAIGGAIIGDRSARNRRQRDEIQRQADRAVLVDRLLRHEVINAAAIVQGYAQLLRDGQKPDAIDAIESAGGRIETAVETVGTITDTNATQGPVDLAAVVEECAAGYDAVTVDRPSMAFVRADDRLEIVVRELLDFALEHRDSDASAVEVAVTMAEEVVSLRVSHAAQTVTEDERTLLEAGLFPEYDDPDSGFSLQIVRLLVDRYDGDIVVGDSGSTITVTLQRVRPDGGRPSAIGLSQRQLASVVGVSLLAGIAMGGYLQYSSGVLPVIGALYAVPNPVVGWLTHLFHSVVFGLLFAAGITQTRLRTYRGRGQVAVALGWGVVLWLVAAGFVMPLWLQLTGAMAMLPNLTGPGLVGHLVWGAVLGVGYVLLSG
jgi:hypothetical protein